jgi:GT2 family glycosyltransferase
MSGDAPTLSVIIPSYNTAPLVRQCLRSILSRPRPVSVEIIAVDNGSSDGTAELIRNEFPEVKVIALPANHGYGAACNRGAQHAQGGILLFLNSDTQVQEGALDVVVEAFRRQPSPAAVACHEVDPAGNTVLSCYSHHTLRSGISFLTGYRLFKREGDRYRVAGWDRKTDRWVDNVSGFAWAIRRETLNQLGGFDEELFLYCEEQDMAMRLEPLGGKILYCADARILHLGGGSSKPMGRFATRRQWVESFVHLRRKHGVGAGAWLDRIVLYPFLLLWRVGLAAGLDRGRRPVDPKK